MTFRINGYFALVVRCCQLVETDIHLDVNLFNCLLRLQTCASWRKSASLHICSRYNCWLQRRKGEIFIERFNYDIVWIDREREDCSWLKDRWLDPMISIREQLKNLKLFFLVEVTVNSVFNVYNFISFPPG